MNSLKRDLLFGLPILTLVLLFAPALRGAGEETGSARWENLRSTTPGSTVRVVLKNVATYEGRLKGVSDEGLTVVTASGEKTFARNTIQRVSTKGQSHRKRNLLVGLGVGAVAGVIVGVADPELAQGTCAQGSCVDAGTVSLVTFGGGIAGAAVGAAIPTGGWHEVFRAPAEAVGRTRRNPTAQHAGSGLSSVPSSEFIGEGQPARKE